MNERIVMDGMELLESALVAWHVRAAVGLATVALAALALRSCRERTRHRVLAWGMVAAVLMPTLAALAPSAWELPVTVVWQLDNVEPAASLTTTVPQLAPVAEQVAAAAQPATRSVDFGTVALMVWLVGAGLCLTGVVVAAIGAVSLRKSASTGPTNVRALFERMQLEAKTSARLGFTARVGGPMVLGVLVPTVLLPLEARTWSELRLRAVLAHELGHVAHSDHRWFAMMHAVRGLLWFNPLAWLVARAFFRSAEFSADEAAVSATMNAPNYAKELLSFASAGGPSSAPLLAAAALGSPDVGTRIRRLLSSPPAVRQLRRVVPVTVGLLGAWACIVLARPASLVPPSDGAPLVRASEANNLLPVPDGAHRIAMLRRGGLAVTTSAGERWSHDAGAEPLRQGHLLVSMHEFFVENADDTRPVVVQADRSVTFAELVDVLYSAGKAGVSSYYLEVSTDAGPRVLSISPPRFSANPNAVEHPALRIGVAVGNRALRVSTRPSLSEPARYDDPQRVCQLQSDDTADLQRTAQQLCAATDGGQVEMTYSGIQSTTYGALTDAIIATALPCDGIQLIEAGAMTLEPEGSSDCGEVLADIPLVKAD